MAGPHVAIVGGGVYGWAIALRLTELGARASVIDERPPDDGLRASGGLTRVLRLEYGADAHYSELTLRARERWRQIERGTGKELYREIGVLYLVPEHDDGEWERRSMTATRELGHAGTVLDRSSIARRWPVLRPDGIGWGLFNPTGGFLWANRATALLAELARSAGAAHVAERAAFVAADRVTLAGGGELRPEHVIVAAGAWTRMLLPALPVRATRQVTAYLGAGPGDVPVFADGSPFAMYGIPAHDGHGLKIASHLPGPDGDPGDPGERVVRADELTAFRDYAMRRFRLAPADAEVAHADVCFYAMTPTEHPIIARLPDGLVVCAGFSGHGFKFAPVVAAAAAELTLDREPSIDLSPFCPPG